jgi:FkbM family methyltransferase
MEKLNYIFHKLITVFKVASLGANLYSKIILLYYNFLPFLTKKTRFFSYRERRIIIKKFSRKAEVYLNGFHDEYEIFKEILSNEEYKIDLQPRIIFDLGSNVGFSVIYFALKYPEARIFGFEPDLINFRKLQKNIASLKNVQIFNLAVAGENGERDFFLYPGKTISSSFTKRLENQKAITVGAKNFDTLFSDFNIEKIDLLKIDVEGAEYEIFSSLRQKERIGAIIGELHLDLMGAGLEEFKNTLPGFLFEITNASKEKRLFFKAFNHENQKN